jgi:hypothetical protein
MVIFVLSGGSCFSYSICPFLVCYFVTFLGTGGKLGLAVETVGTKFNTFWSKVRGKGSIVVQQECVGISKKNERKHNLNKSNMNQRRICWTVGGDRIFYAADVSTKTADLTTAKISINSVLSTPGAKFLGLDIKDFYLGTSMKDYEYMHIPMHMTPQAIIEQ